MDENPEQSAHLAIVSAINRWKTILKEREGEVLGAQREGDPSMISMAYSKMYRVQRIIVDLENAYAESGIVQSAGTLMAH